jgi:hypothetical protein
MATQAPYDPGTRTPGKPKVTSPGPKVTHPGTPRGDNREPEGDRPGTPKGDQPRWGAPGGEAPPGGAWGLHPHKEDETSPRPALSAGMGMDIRRVGEEGVEPSRPYGHTDLNRARLPFRHSPGRDAEASTPPNGPRGDQLNDN